MVAAMAEGALINLDLAIRSGACVVLLLTAALLLRDYGRLAVARLGAAFVLSTVAYAVSSAPVFQGAAVAAWRWPVEALAVGVNVIFWLFARILFDDEFRPRRVHAVLWTLIVAFGLAQAVSEDLGPPGLAIALGTLRSIQAVAFALAAGFQTLASWRADLVEPRRRLRLLLVAAAFVHTVLTVAGAVAARGSPGAAERLADIAALAAIGLAVAWSLLQVNEAAALIIAGRPASPPPAPRPLDRPDRRALAALEQLMCVERLYRQDRLSIGALAHRLGLPEYRLRRLINQGLGARNFNAFLNRYRLDEVKAALADPGQAETPILTIALDSGFNSLGPFNRAFKADTGATPTDYRRERLAEAGRIPKSA